MKNIVTIIGARPQFIKASVVSHAIAESLDLREFVIHTGQHFDANMSDIFFSELGMKEPDCNLGVNRGLHGEMTAKMLSGIEQVLLAERPDAVLVYGDTNSTLAGALAAAKLNIPVAHVEAGLRSFNMRMPEEVNRILTDRVSAWLFAPTDVAVENLRQEGVQDERIVPVGDVMFDVARHYGERVKPVGGPLSLLHLNPGSYLLATIHRAENTDDPGRMAAIVDGLSSVAADLQVVWPIHPRTHAVLDSAGHLEGCAKNFHIIPPVSYLEMVQLEKYAAAIATDSGGVQKEAFFHGVPCVTLRDETEWVELIDSEWNRLAPPTDGVTISSNIRAALGTVGASIEPYGDGCAAGKIVARLIRDLR